jgi:hypothetical protein
MMISGGRTNVSWENLWLFGTILGLKLQQDTLLTTYPVLPSTICPVPSLNPSGTVTSSRNLGTEDSIEFRGQRGVFDIIVG